MTKVVHGKIHGRTIELAEDPGIAEGQDIEVQIRVFPQSEKWGAGVLRTAGALADDAEWDSIMEQIHSERKLDRRSPPEVE